MKLKFVAEVCVVLAIVGITAEAQVIPSMYTSRVPTSVNGSSETGKCQRQSTTVTCENPASSVLFDGHIPTLTGLNGDQWASQLLTLQREDSNNANITFNFHNIPCVEKIEVVMFYCSDWWGIETKQIRVLEGETPVLDVYWSIDYLLTCDYLVKLCLPYYKTTGRNFTLQNLTLQFTDADWVHLAEVIIRNDTNSKCTPTTILTDIEESNPTASEPVHTSTPDTHTSATSTIQTTTIIVIAIALLVAVILG